MSEIKILLVEDESIEALDIKRTLESFGYEVPYVASSGEEAVEKALEIMPDLILMDVILKGDSDGIEAVTKIKDLNIPVIYLTAHSEESTIERAKLTEPYGYIIKPYDRTEIKYAIELAIYKNQMEKELKKSEEKYRRIVENVLDAYFMGDIEGKITMASPSAAHLYRFDSPKEMIGIPALSLYTSSKDRQKMLKHLKTHGKVLNMEVKALRKDGTSFWASMNVQYYYNKDGQIQGTEAFVRDISKSKKAEKELKTSESYYKAIFEHTGTATVILDENSTISLANAEFEKLSGYSKKELESKKSWTDFVKKEYLEKMRGFHRLRRTDPHAAPEIYDFKFTDRQGNVKNIHLNVDIIPGTNKSVASLLDITDRQKSAKRLEKSVLRFRALAEYSVDGIITTDANGKILYFNNSLLKMFGYTQDELQNSPLTILMPERYRENFLESLKKFRVTGEHRLAGRTIETLGLKKNGKEFPFEMSLTKWETGLEIYFTSIIRNINERKKSFKALRESEEKFKSLVDNAADILLVHDFDGKLVEVNKRASESLGYSQEELLQMNIMDIEQDTDLKSAQEHVLPKIKPNEPFSLLGHFRRKNGSIFPVEVRFAIVDIQGQRLFMGLARDITAQLKLENSLKESEKRLFDIIDFLPDATLAIDNNGIVITWNKAIEDMTGFKALNMVGKGDYEYSKPFFGIRRQMLIDLVTHSNENIEKHYDFVERRGEAIMAQTEAPLKGTNRILWGKAVPLHDGQGNIKGAIEVIRDITERIHAEKEIIESLKEKEVLLREIHHRVKNNMQIISSLLNLQIQNVEDEEAVNVLKESQGRVKSMAMIHEKLYQSPNFTDINVKDYIDKLIFDIFYSYGIKIGTIESVLDIEDINIGMETAIPLGLIVNELVTNSVKYAFPKGEGIITIDLKSLQNKMELIITDNGIGLPKDIDIDNTNSLGLQLVKSLVNQIEGKIELDQTHGTEFKIIFKELEYKERI
ncbi:PAS domain S-box protein [Methanobacterium spitsbergense]|uniref:PAS domain S-box protein n=1 Tax=Methanobacterium spitsbergense TaxID=2874285 RepID=A0A8T5UUU0_9EURY|nr:PAS domain S-box protein [Methanobacterium spitsbergense]MBZ2164633.1 PAS domain S-box protein [Methanobacterium spitsbergense]